MTCISCKEEYDSSMEFVEDIELLQAIDYFVSIEVICPKCIYKLRDEIEVVTNFMTAEKH